MGRGEVEPHRADASGWAASVSADRGSGKVVMAWGHPLATDDILGWEVALGWDEWRLPWQAHGTDPAITMPWRIFAAPLDCRVLLVVTAVLTEGRRVGPVSMTVMVPAYDTPPPTRSWHLGEPEVVVDDATRVAAGRRYWPDGTLGFARIGEGVAAWAPDGRASLTPDGTLAPGPPDQVIRGPERVVDPFEPADYAAGGPIVDVGDGVLAMVWHGEIHVAGDPDDFWGFLGLARSTDGGRTFHDLGRIVTPHIGSESPRRIIHTEVGGGPYALTDDGFIHVYYRDTLDSGRSAPALNLCVARCRLDVLVAAVHAGRAPRFTKRHEGSWSQPALGGRADDLLPGASVPRWFDVIRHDRTGWLMVSTGGLAVDWAYVVRSSSDGLEWSEGELVGEPIRDAETLYLTVTGSDLADPRQAVGPDLWLWRTWSARGASRRWDDARLERLPLHQGGSAAG